MTALVDLAGGGSPPLCGESCSPASDMALNVSQSRPIGVVDDQAVASVMPNNVSVLMENPSNLTKMKVPMSETGVAIK